MYQILENILKRNSKLIISACIFFILVSVHLTAWASKGKQDSSELKKVKLQLKWKHQFQFAGYYAAIEKGYYKNSGIDVELIEPQPGEEPGYKVLHGEAEFGIATSDVILMREQGYKPVVLASIFQHSAQILIASANSGIKNIHDLVGKKIALEPHAADIITYMHDEGILLDQCTILHHNFDVSQLINGEVDAITAYVTDEPFILNQKNFEYTIITPSMGGIDFYGDLLFCSEQLIKKDPQLVKNFVAASLKGWKYALENQQEIIDLIFNKYSQRHSKEHLQFEATRTIQHIIPDVVELGYSNPGRWESIAGIYQEANIIETKPDITGMFYSDFLDHKTHVPWNLVIGFLVLITIIIGVTSFYYLLTRKLKHEIIIRKETEMALKESEKRYRNLYERSSDPILILRNGIFIDCNKATLKQLNYRSKKRIVGKSPDKHSPKKQPNGMDSATLAASHIDKAKKTGHHRFEWVHLDSNKKEIYFDVTLTFLPSEEPDTFYTVWRNINEAKLAEKELNKYHQKLYELVDERTKELKLMNETLMKKNAELEKYNQLFVGRELRIKELKDKLRKLESGNDK